jgi:hypothetical protein
MCGPGFADVRCFNGQGSGTSIDLIRCPDQRLQQENIMNGIIYIVGLIVVVGIVLSFIGVHV